MSTVDKMLFERVISRLKERLGVASDSDIAALLAMSPNAFANRKKSGSIPYEELIVLAKMRDVDINWLLKGDPKEGGDGEAGTAIKHPVMRPRQLNPAERFAEFELVERKGVLGSAGPGAENVVLQPRGALAFRRDWLQMKRVSPRELIVVDIVGDSMERTLFGGDVVVFREQLEVTADDIYLFLLEGRLLVKRLSYKKGSAIEVIADNRDRYPAFTLTEKEAIAQRFEVRGRFFWRGGDRLQ